MIGAPRAIMTGEERCTCRGRCREAVVCRHIVRQGLIEIGAEWHQPCFMELGVADREEGDGRLVVGAIEGQRFAQP